MARKEQDIPALTSKQCLFLIAFGLAATAIAAAVVYLGIRNHSEKLDAIEVTLNPGMAEHADTPTPGLGGIDFQPDYELSVRVGKKWYDLGDYANTPISDGLTFQADKAHPMRMVNEVRLIDTNGLLAEEVLEQQPTKGLSITGGRYSFALTQVHDTQAGIRWFLFHTWIGWVVLSVYCLAMLPVVLPLFAEVMQIVVSLFEAIMSALG